MVVATLPDLAKDYVQKMILRTGPGAKAMLVDSETKQYLSTVYTQSEVLKQEVFLVERIDNETAEKLMHMKAVCFLRPSYSSLSFIAKSRRTCTSSFGPGHIQSLGSPSIQFW